MRTIEKRLSAAVLVLFTGCARTLLVGDGTPPPERLDPGVGYVAGVFSTSFDSQWAFDLTDARGGKREISFGGEDVALNGELRVYPLPPGKYRVAKWKGFDAGWGRSDADEKIPETDRFAQPFELGAGQVVFLGKFVATRNRTLPPGVSWSPGKSMTYFDIRSIALSRSDALDALQAAAPALAAAQVSCVLCARD